MVRAAFYMFTCWRRQLILGLVNTVLVLSFFSSSVLAREVKDLALGVALYEFFQENDFDALSELLVAEQTQRLPQQAEFASQFMAGIMLSYGMDEAAQERIAALNEETVASTLSAENASRSQYYLAKLLYRKGRHTEAYQILQSLDKSLSHELKPEMAFLLHSSFLQLEPLHASLDGASHESEMESVQSDSAAVDVSKLRVNFKKARRPSLRIWSDYLHYNDSIVSIASAQSVLPEHSQRDHEIDSAANEAAAENANRKLSKELKQSQRQLERLAQKLSNSLGDIDQSMENARFDELLALRDRALLSTAYLYLVEEKPREAVKHLRLYSADGLEVKEAMLAYGWAELQQRNFNRAIAPWAQLAEGDIGDASTRESLLGLAHVYELQGDSTAALQAYNTAIARFETEQDLLASFATDSNREQLLELFDVLQSRSVGWLEDYDMSSVEGLSKDAGTLLARLQPLVGSNEFSLLLKQRRDLHWLKNLIDHKGADLVAMSDSVDNQRLRFQQVFDQGERDILLGRYAALKEKIARLQPTLELAQAREIVVLMNEDERKLQSKAKSAQEKLDKILLSVDQMRNSEADFKAVSEFRQRMLSQSDTARLIAGSIAWNVAESADQRIWALTKTKKQAQATFTEIEQSLIDLEQLVPEATTQNRATTAINGLAKRQQNIQSTTDSIAQEIQKRLLMLVDNSISSQSELLNDYLAQAQLAKARLLDDRFMSQDITVNTADNRASQSKKSSDRKIVATNTLGESL